MSPAVSLPALILLISFSFSLTHWLGREQVFVSKVFSLESFWKPAGNIIIESLVLSKNPFTPYVDVLWSLCSTGVVTILLIGPLKQMACHTLIEFVLINICYLSAVWQRVVWRREGKLVSAQKSWPGKRWHHPHEVTWGIFSPYRTCSLGLRISTECTNTSVQRSAPQAQLAGSPPLPLVCWRAVSIIAAPAVNCEAQVIVRGADRRAETAPARGTSVEPRWAHATPSPSSHADSARFGCYGQCICHNVSTPCSSPLWPSQGWNHSSFYSSPGLEVIHHEARDLHQLFRWE